MLASAAQLSWMSWGCPSRSYSHAFSFMFPVPSQVSTKQSCLSVRPPPPNQGHSWRGRLCCDHHPLEPTTLEKGSTVEKMRGTKVGESCWNAGKLCASADMLLLTRTSVVSQNSSSLVHGPPGLGRGGHSVQNTMSRASLTSLLLGHELHSCPCRRQDPPAPTSAAVLRLR